MRINLPTDWFTCHLQKGAQELVKRLITDTLTGSCTIFRHRYGQCNLLVHCPDNNQYVKKTIHGATPHRQSNKKNSLEMWELSRKWLADSASLISRGIPAGENLQSYRVNVTRWLNDQVRDDKREQKRRATRATVSKQREQVHAVDGRETPWLLIPGVGTSHNSQEIPESSRQRQRNQITRPVGEPVNTESCR